MATLKMVVNFVECDGCQVLFGGPHGYSSPMEVRAAAYQEGWRFPSHVSATGKPGSTTSDVCPECVPGWVAQKRESRARAINRDELARRLGGGAS